MNNHVQQWEAAHDRRSIFLGCYALMTANMLDALDTSRFADDAWVAQLLDRFAEYYFNALELYETRQPETPRVWQLAHDTAQREHVMTVQHLLIGVNAHINYDLVFAVAELLSPEWETLTTEQRDQRRADYNLVNAIIGETIDQVQDQILEPRSPWLDLIDKAFGPVDEWLISKVIERWRDEVWQNALRYVAVNDPAERDTLRAHIETAALRLGRDMLGEIL
jgi:hypothetical protein